MPIRSIKEVKNLRGKRVLVRADFNVPIKSGKVKDDFKIQKTLPTIQYLIKNGAKVILLSHLGRPKGIDPKLSLKPVAKYLEKLLQKNIQYLNIQYKNIRVLDIGYYVETAQRKIEKMNPGSVAMLENIRFIPGEEENDPKLAKALASLADIFVLDGFAVAHRGAASVSGVAKFLPSYAGLLLFDEISVLYKVVSRPKKPLVVILGGAKVETKIPVMKQLLPKADYILVGGQIANTYWWAKGNDVGGSTVGKEFKKEILKYCSSKKIILPTDVVVGKQDGSQARVLPVSSEFRVQSLPAGKTGSEFAIYDIGPATIRLFSKYIKKAQTLIWNGAMGVFEVHPYHSGTYALADLFAARSTGKAFGVVGGGETVEVIKARGLINQIDLVSTGGGAMLEFLGGKKLPGIEALR